jgi:hypothetical protein
MALRPTTFPSTSQVSWPDAIFDKQAHGSDAHPTIEDFHFGVDSKCNGWHRQQTG